MTEDIKVTFIIPKHCRSENDCSEDMQLAFTTCEQHCGGGLFAQWEHETKYNKFQGLTKRDVFVLSDFEGELYEKLKATKCLLVGPRCLSCCLTEGAPIPSGPEPVYTVAMRGLVVTASGMSKQQKDKIKKKVFWMGGIYNSVLTDDTTHLVSDTVLSDKYMKSVEKGIPVMCESWIDAVWDMSLRLNISGSSSEFDVHHLPPFANLQVTTSGISRKDKQMIMKLVNEHGGNFSGAFQSETTDIVILTKDGVGSEKYKAALEYGKACVLPTWVKDSAAMGVALPLAKYRVAGASTSSPLAEHRAPDMSLNFSRITNARAPSNYVDETRSTDLSTFSGRMKLSQDIKRTSDASVDKEVLAAFENLDMSCIKKAGPIFDGFCIWVTGLDGIARERATACVSRAGGVRYDCPHDRVTHIVAGSKTAASMATQALPNVPVLSALWLANSVKAGRALDEAEALPNVPVLSALWLANSVKAGRALDEAEFLIDTKPATPKKSTRKPAIEPASPMSKRNLQLLRPPADLPPPTPEPIKKPEAEPVPDIVNHYLSQNIEPDPVPAKSPDPAAPNATVNAMNDAPEITLDEPTEEIEQIFRGIKIEVQGLDEEAICEIGAEVAAAGGVLAAAGAGGTHVLVPLDFDPEELVTKDAEPITVFWVKDCLSQQELLPIQYYHRPVKLPPLSNPGPLHGVVASLSTYSGVERAFLDELAKLLGATTQLRFCRRNTANALASTHLICPTPSGDKYTGALKWGLPAVNAAWLTDCAKEGRRVSEKEYLVGDTKAPPSPEPVQKVQSENDTTEQPPSKSDKENAMLPPTTAPKRCSVPSKEQTPKTSKGSSAIVPKRCSVPSKEQTPKTSKGSSDNENEMSPASRYIAMARQGLLGGDTQDTPKRVHDLIEDAKQGRYLSLGVIDFTDNENEMSRQGLLGGDTQDTPKRVHDLIEDAKQGRYLSLGVIDFTDNENEMSRQGLLGGDTQDTPKRVHDLIEDAKQVLLLGVNDFSDNENEMSPASRYIAMARQGLLGGDTQDTPKRVHDLIEDAKQGSVNDSSDNENEMSPASRYIAMARQGLLGGDTQDTPKRVHDLIEDAKQGRYLSLGVIDFTDNENEMSRQGLLGGDTQDTPKRVHDLIGDAKQGRRMRPMMMMNDFSDNENEMSPASRYIAMSRQGLLGGDTQDTPKRVHDLIEDAKQGR
ncbi:twin BRCT domain-containing protein [Phthorimaea operculella]|nr:twin BRCT domain-containing protein [Phthorimaea operculella]